MRFPEFEGQWEEKKLGQLLEFKNGINATKEQYGRGFKFINVLDILNNDFLTHENIIGKVDVEQEIVDRYPVNYGDILFQRSSETREEVGSANVYVDKEHTATFGGFVIRGRKIADYDPIFLNNLLKTNLIRNNITTKSGGSTRYNVGQDTLSATKISLPSLAEQQKISSFLSSLDEKIKTQSKIIKNLKTLMISLTENVYAQKIRFKESSGLNFPVWEKVRLDSCILTFVVPMRDKPKELDGEIPWCRIEDFEGKYLSSSKSGQGVSKNTIKAMNLKVYPINTLIVSCSANLGFCAIIKKELITNQTFIGLVPNELKVNVEYLYYVMKLSAKKLNALSSGTTISYLSREQFEKFEISLPTLKEQNKIVNFLSAIDQRIDTANILLNHYQIQKKYLLENLFI